MYSTLRALQQRHIEVHCNELLGMISLSGDDEAADAGYCPGGGLQALHSFAAVGQGGPQQCPISLGNKLKLNRLALEADDIQATAAAYGSQLQCLSILDCILTKAAWVTITADLFPRLSHLHVLMANKLAAADIPLHLIALGLSWPKSRPLAVSVDCGHMLTYLPPYQRSVLTQHLMRQLQSCKEVLQACAANHVSLSWTDDEW
jgi:hypothetical protein